MSQCMLCSADSSPEITLAQLRTRATRFEVEAPISKSQNHGQELKRELGLKLHREMGFAGGLENSLIGASTKDAPPSQLDVCVHDTKQFQWRCVIVS